MKALITTIVIVILVILAFVWLMGDDNGDLNGNNSPTPTATLSTTSPAPGPEEFNLDEQSDSNETGKVTLTPTTDGKLKVTLNIDNAPATAQPAHIHAGTCKNIGAIKYSLNSVVNGKSETTLNVSLDQLKAQGDLAINVHKSAAQSNIYVACTDLDF